MIIDAPKIAAVSDAGLAVWDDEKQFSVTEKIIQHKNKIIPYLDHCLAGIVEQTYPGGTQVFKKRAIIAIKRGFIPR